VEAKSAVPALIQAMKEADPEVRLAAGATLKKIGPEAAAKAGVQ
jgi:HEAT repeat protein